jgi:hypothetical protein
MAGDDVNTILTVYVREFERAKRQDEIRESWLRERASGPPERSV